MRWTLKGQHSMKPLSACLLAISFVSLTTGCTAIPNAQQPSRSASSNAKDVMGQFPMDDGLAYPGDPGTEAVREFNRQWAEHVSKLPPEEQGRPSALESFSWMVGHWTALARNFEADATNRRAMTEGGRGPANVSFTPDQHWLRIEGLLRPNWFNARYFGFDRAAKRYVFHEITGPGVVYLTPLTSAGWKEGRMVFGPAKMLYYRMPSTVRMTLIRNSSDQFRTVFEDQLPDGTFVVSGDILYTRWEAPE
jgi:hypothetical protein